MVVTIILYQFNTKFMGVIILYQSSMPVSQKPAANRHCSHFSAIGQFPICGQQYKRLATAGSRYHVLAQCSMLTQQLKAAFHKDISEMGDRPSVINKSRRQANQICSRPSLPYLIPILYSNWHHLTYFPTTVPPAYTYLDSSVELWVHMAKSTDHHSPGFSSCAFLASSSCASLSLSFSASFSSISFSKATLSSTVTSLLLSRIRWGIRQTASFLRFSPSSSVIGFCKRLIPVTWVSTFFSSSSLAIWFQRRLRQLREGRKGKGLQMAFSLLFRTDSFCRDGSASSPRISVSSFSHTYSCFRLLILATPFNFRSLFFRNYSISIVECPFQFTSLTQFSLRLSRFSPGSRMFVRAFTLLPERLRNCSCYSPYCPKTPNDPTWFFDALSHSRLGNWLTRDRSEMALVFRSRQRTSLNRSTTGKSRSISFSAIERRVQATLRLLAVLPSPLSPPFSASSNFFRSYSAFRRAYSSAFLRYSSLRRSSYCLCLSSSSSCSGVFSGGGATASSSMSSCIYNHKTHPPSLYPSRSTPPPASPSPFHPLPHRIISPFVDRERISRRLLIMRVVFALLLLAQVLLGAYDWTNVENAIQNAINDRIFTGCVLGISTNNATLFKKAYGTTGPKYGFYAPPVTVDMKFDLGLLTEPVGINLAYMEAWDQKKIDTTSRVGLIFFDFNNNGKGYVTVQNLLEHNSGMPVTYTAAFPKTPAELLKAIDTLKLDFTEGTKFQLSELGPIVLGQLLMKIQNKTLPDAFFQILTIAGMRDTVYLPKTDRSKIAPSGYTDRIAWGTPYNKIAHFLNDTAGNAGLFSTVTDLITYMQLMLNKGKLPGYSRVFSEEATDRFLNVTKYPKYNNTRALGWETIPAGNCPCGKKFSPGKDSFGMADPSSGSFIWADKKRNVTIVLLANGAYPAKAASDPTLYQGAISDAIMTALGY